MSSSDLTNHHTNGSGYTPVTLENLAERVEFDRCIISLACLVPEPLEAVATAFKEWLKSDPWPWRDAYDYAVEYSARHGILPFPVSPE